MQTTHYPKREQIKMPQRNFKPRKPQAWSHQNDLQSGIGKRIGLKLIDGTLISGTLAEADAYTVKIGAEGQFSSRIFNKSALIYFWFEG